MSTILAVYSEQPTSAAVNQNPGATRFQFGARWFDVLNGPMTQSEADAYEAGVVAQAAAVQAEIVRIAAINADADTITLLDQLRTANASGINTFVDNNVTLSGATVAALRTEMQTLLRVFFKRILKVLVLLAKRAL